jgi:Rieske 2Fe-2S family protein
MKRDGSKLMGNGMDSLDQALADVREGFSLPGAFYSDPAIFEAEYDLFLKRHWLLAGHASEIPGRGDYVVVEFAGASVILVRGQDGEIHAMHNVCRHRGARICTEPRGSARQLVCRYHAWSYRLDGSLQSWRHMPAGLDKGDFGLIRCGVAIFEGLIFITLDPDNAPDFAELTGHLRPHWQRYGLADCRVAFSETYVVDANWKLGVENNLECYHCLPSHPEYSSVSGFVKSDEKVSEAAIAAHDGHRAKLEALLAASGAPAGRSDVRSVDGQLARAGMLPLMEGIGSASAEGKPVAPLLGELTGYDESTTTGAFGFHSYLFAANDYALAITYIPRGVDRTDVVAKWLVRGDAEEGRDYDPAALRWLWDETTRQDKWLIELNARGVATRGYRPGPYAELESGTAEFVTRYVALMRG